MIHSHFCPLMARSWIFVENTEQKRHHTECYSSSVSLSVHLSLALCPSFSVSVCRRLSVSAALLYVCCTVTLTEVSLFFLVLCIALRKCSTPHSAGSGSKGGGNWRRSRSDSLSLSSVLFFPFFFWSLSLFLPLLSAVNLHWTVEELSHRYHTCFDFTYMPTHRDSKIPTMTVRQQSTCSYLLFKRHWLIFQYQWNTRLCNVKDVACRNKTTENYLPTLLSLSLLRSIFASFSSLFCCKLYCFGSVSGLSTQLF